ncbi:LLM class F420-dependent oxidoreductase [Georgenia alba]|uniref:LLM class F420-dependent oxidoreductase n=1 Tax=Georgenia alba TaxID=2233858 RepID=A0ABW2Q2H8_9MICO
MTVELGRYGVWAPHRALTPELAQEVERLGYGAIWLGVSPGDLSVVDTLLEATERITVATGIVNMWQTSPQDAAAAYHRIEREHPGRFLLGVGIGHPEATAEYRSPYATMVDYLDRLDAAQVPLDRCVLAALGPRALALAAERTAGAHPYLVSAAHTRQAREVLGPDALLAPEHKIVLDTDAAAARAAARPTVANPYLKLRNYRANLLRLGYTEEDMAGEGSDRLIDALVAHGDAETVAASLTAHLDAGADHVCIQVLPQGTDPRPTLRALADALSL